MQKFLRFLTWVAGIAIVVGVLLRLVLVENWTVPIDPYLDASVRPTLASGDTVLVLTRGEPGFGDLVRCRDPEDPTIWLIGRIAGMPGDTVEIAGPTLRVNGVSYSSSEACVVPQFEVEHPNTGHGMQVGCSRISMGGGWHYRGNLSKYMRSNDARKQVGAGRLFLISDNRDIHDDSRDYGTLPVENCTGRIVFRLWGAGGWSDSERRMDFVR